MNSILISTRRKNQLEIDGDWNALEKHFEGELRTRRPFVWMHRKWFLPGNLETQFALFLYNRGRLEEALKMNDAAIRRLEGKPRLFESIHRKETSKTSFGSLRARTLILTGLGRYDEARAIANQLQALQGQDGSPNPSLALLELFCGNLDAAIELAQTVNDNDPQSNSMRGILAISHSTKGNFEQALQALSFKPSDVATFFSPAGLKIMNESPEGTRLLEIKEKKLAQFYPPARLIMTAQVFVAMEDFASAVRTLDEAEKSLGSQPALRASYCRHRACSLAGLGKSAEAESYLERLRDIVKALPSRSLRWETHYTSGQTYLYLGQFDRAIEELTGAQRIALHPIEKHATAYWTARVNAAAGNKREAIEYYRQVAADHIPSWMQKKATEIIAANGDAGRG